MQRRRLPAVIVAIGMLFQLFPVSNGVQAMDYPDPAFNSYVSNFGESTEESGLDDATDLPDLVEDPDLVDSEDGSGPTQNADNQAPPDPAASDEQDRNQEYSPQDQNEIQAAASAKGRYVLAVADPGTDDYRRWTDPEMRAGETLQYDVCFAWYEDGELEIISTHEEGMGIALTYDETPFFNLYSDEDGYHLEITTTDTTPTGWHEMILKYTRPDNGKRAEYELTVIVYKHDFAIVVSDPGSDNYREWDNPTVREGENARYALHLARIEDGKYYVEDENGLPYISSKFWVEKQNAEGFFVSQVSGGYYINIYPTLLKHYEIELYYSHPQGQFGIDVTLTLDVMEDETQFPQESCFVIGDGSQKNGFRAWGDGESAIVGEQRVYPIWLVDSASPSDSVEISAFNTVEGDDTGQFGIAFLNGRYYLQINGKQAGLYSLTLRATLSDAQVEQTLQLLVEEPDYNAYDGYGVAMMLFTVDGITQCVPSGTHTIYYREDGDCLFTVERYRETEDGRIPITDNRFVSDADDSLISLPTEKTKAIWRIKSPTVQYPVRYPMEWPEPGVEGDLALYFVAVENRQPNQKQLLFRAGSTNLDGDNYILLSRISAQLWDYNLNEVPTDVSWEQIQSSNPEVVSIQPDAEDPYTFYIIPVGYGEATLTLHHDRYMASILMRVVEGSVQLSMEATANGYKYIESDHPNKEKKINGTVASPYHTNEEWNDPIPVPFLTEISLYKQKESYWSLSNYLFDQDLEFTSSDPSVLRVVTGQNKKTYLEPLRSGTSTLTYHYGALTTEFEVLSDPDYDGDIGYTGPGFYSDYGPAQIPVKQVELTDQSERMMLVFPSTSSFGVLQAENFHFSNPDLVQLELYHSQVWFHEPDEYNSFRLIPMKEGATTLTYRHPEYGDYVLEISVGSGQTSHGYDLVVRDASTPSGYRIFAEESGITGENRELELLFARVSTDVSGTQSYEPIGFPKDFAVEPVSDHSQFSIEPQGLGWVAKIRPNAPGLLQVNCSGTPPGSEQPLKWIKTLTVTDPLMVTETSVAAINEAIRNAPITPGQETVILLPPGTIPLDPDTPIVLSRPVTLRGQNTILSSDVAAICQTPGAKLQNLTIQPGPGDVEPSTRSIYRHAGVGSVTFPMAVMGDGILTIENCVLDGDRGSPTNAVQYGISVYRSRVAFSGTNIINNFSQAGLVLESRQGLRGYASGLTFEENGTAVWVRYIDSRDPYFFRLTDSNFIGNRRNVVSGFRVNFAHNYFDGGSDGDNILKSPQYETKLQFKSDGSVQRYPNMEIEDALLSQVEIINFESQAPISTRNFSFMDEPILIQVKDLLDSQVLEGENTSVVLQWMFPIAPQSNDSPDFIPDAYIDMQFDLPEAYQVDRYQGIGFAHHGPLPMSGAEISVQKRILFEDEILYLYKLSDDSLLFCGEIFNDETDHYVFFLDSCSDYIITSVKIESVDPPPDGGSSGGEEPDDGDNGSHGGTEEPNDGNNGSGGEKEKPDSGNNGSGGEKEKPDDGNSGFGNEEEESDDSRNIVSGNISLHENPVREPHYSDELMTENSLEAETIEWLQQYEEAPDKNALDEFHENRHVPTNSSASLQLHDSMMDYSHLPYPSSSNYPPQSEKVTANLYTDSLSIRNAFDRTDNGKVVIDAGTRTVVSPLAFELLNIHSDYELELKGDGYLWRFSSNGSTLSSPAPFTAFDTSVKMDWYAREGFATLSFSSQYMPPLSATLELDASAIPQSSQIQLLYHATERGYYPANVPYAICGNTLTVTTDQLKTIWILYYSEPDS